MEEKKIFDRCLSCFAPREGPGPCRRCGYADGLQDQPGWILPPGTILRGRYVLGKVLSETDREIAYLAWDLEQDRKLEAVEYFPKDLVTRDCTRGPDLVCFPGREAQVEAGKEAFFQKARLFYNCVTRVDQIYMDFVVRNNTCYYVRSQRSPRHPKP